MGLNGFRNVLLRQLPPDAVARLNLHKVSFRAPREIETMGGEIHNLVFLEDGVAAIATTFCNGLQAGVGLAGYDSVLGASAFLGTRRSLNRVYMLNEGTGYISPTSVALQEFQRHGDFQRLIFRSTQAQLVQSMQTAGCNARHNVQQRLARWLLLCDDRLSGRPLLVSQEVISELLGNRRTSISVAAATLQEQGLISYSRARITVLDRAGLERESCECYRIVRDHLQNYDAGEAGFGVQSSSCSDSEVYKSASMTAAG
jgi:CRP-like cAMP-binding protein